MKNFILIFMGANYSDLGFSPKEMQERLGNWGDWTKRLSEKGIYKGGDGLTEAIRRVEGADKVVIDRTSAELKEVIGGYILITAKDFDEATEIAKDYPDFDLPGGAVEVREIMDYSA